jgi:hypothetical protein
VTWLAARAALRLPTGLVSHSQLDDQGGLVHWRRGGRPALASGGVRRSGSRQRVTMGRAELLIFSALVIASSRAVPMRPRARAGFGKTDRQAERERPQLSLLG